MYTKYSSNLPTNIDLILPEDQGWKARAQVNFLQECAKVVTDLQDHIRTSKEKPHVIADKVELIIDKERYELTNDFLKDHRDLLFGRDRKPTINVIVRPEKKQSSAQYNYLTNKSCLN